MNTRDLLSRLPRHTEEGPLPESVTSLVHDSRSAGPGSLFVCLEGLSADGHAFARDAVDRGARLIVARRVPDPPAKAALVLVPDTREALARLAPAFHGDPSRQLTLVGVTGTNGKTTSTHFLTAIAEASGIRTGRIGTVGYDFAGRHINAPHTTPEAPVTNRLLREMLDHGVSFCAMEVSSHALDQRRAFGLDFAACLFTNLTQDHLDYLPYL
jgi:UDP-N-acetylmuramoyl-L-alanyl-D-glutamate--2,6-diaminopimelate ligase